MLVTNVLLFLIFETIYILRWTLFRRFTYEHVRKDSEEIALQVCPAISWLTITIQVQFTCAEFWGYGFTLLAFVMWWIGLVWVISMCMLLYLHLMKHPSGEEIDKWLPTAVFIPIVAIFTLGNAAGVIVNNAVNDTHLPDSLAIVPIIVGFLCVGFGLGLGLIMYTVYAHRLFTSGWPSPLKIPSMILTVSLYSSSGLEATAKCSGRPMRTVCQRSDTTGQCCCLPHALRSIRQRLFHNRALCRNHSHQLCPCGPPTRWICDLLDVHRLLCHHRGFGGETDPPESVLVVDNLPCWYGRHGTGWTGDRHGFTCISDLGRHTLRFPLLHLRYQRLFHNSDGVEWRAV